MELTKTRQQLMKIAADLATLNLSGVKLCYAVARSADKISSEMKGIRAAQKPLEEYNRAQGELAQKYAAKDFEGNPKRTENGFIIGDLVQYNAEMAKLDKKFARELAEIEAFMEETVTIEIHSLTEDDIPEDITMAQMRALLPLIEQKE